MSDVLSVLASSLNDTQLAAAARRLKNSTVNGGNRSAALTALIELARSQKRMAVLICANAFDVARLNQEIAWLDPSLKVSSLPDWETLPYDTMSPHADLVSERLETLYNLTSDDLQARPDVLIAAASTAAQRFAPKSYVAGNTFFFRKGQTISIGKLEASLVAAGYGRVEQTMAPGEFAVRGGIMDIFPMGAGTPLRQSAVSIPNRNEAPAALIACVFCPVTNLPLTKNPAIGSVPPGAPLSLATRTNARSTWTWVREFVPLA